jgi:hypothetical protein
MNPELKPLADLIESLSGDVHSLAHEVREGFARMDSRFEAVQARLDLQGGKLRAADLQNRIARLERQRPTEPRP